jgi:hypothetical protein
MASTSARPFNRRLGAGFRGCATSGLWCAIAIGLTSPAALHAQSAAPAAPSAAPASTLPVSPAGAWLADLLDGLDVEHRWLRGNARIAWKSGAPLHDAHGKKITPLAMDETHCSAFAAAAADSLGVYLLHPPEHSHVLLANAQFVWLGSDAGRKAGWRAVPSAVEAQRAANAGELVVAAYKNPDSTQPGHIAIVRPSAVTVARVNAEGPQITQAGFANYRSTELSRGFDHHPGAWRRGGRGGVRFYAHEIDVDDLAGE